MAFNPTDEQRLAIEAKGNILVSAAAGSGKTAVLVERVISKLCSKTENVSADRLLIVTFTNAAATEMRSRIEARLDEECRNNPDDIALLMQKHRLSSAKICTIDSFCIDLVRENFEKLQISPDFKISDGISLRPINEKIAGEIVNTYLEEENPVFLELLDIIGSEYGDENFIDFLLSVYEYSRQLPFPEVWFKSLNEFYNGGLFDEASIWAEYAFETAKKSTNELYSALSSAKELLFVSDTAPEKYLDSFVTLLGSLETLNTISNENNWDSFYEALKNFYTPKLASASKKEPEPFEVVSAKDIYKSVPKALERLGKLFYADKAFINAQYKKLYGPLCLLSDILIDLDSKIFEEYKKQNTFTFHNTEHMALKLLCVNSEEGIYPSPEADELINRFDEVMVDEYQDTNNLQDMLFKVLSSNENKLFVVGDVKQSIYGFRGANPKNFLDKKNRYIPIDKSDSTMPQKIILGKNFRCKPESCEFINYFFELFMNKETGDIIYSGEERLIAGAEYPELDEPSVEFNIIDCSDTEVSSHIAEASFIADYIKRIMGSGEVIRESDTRLRNAKYSDFAILLRSAKLRAPTLAEELKKQGIPVSYTVEDFAESTEISTFLRLISVIDNPQNDVNLLCVLMSPLFSFTAEEMALIRAEHKDGNIYASLVFAAGSGNLKAINFLKTIEKYRLLSVTTPLPRFISFLLHNTGYLDIASVMTDGSRRRANLLLLCSYAEQFYADGVTSLAQFTKRILKAAQGGLKGAGSSSGEAVKIMSIHASKGLQFPVCIVADLGSAFGDKESKMQALYSTDFGIGFKYFDEAYKTKLTTISREAILDRIRATRLEEELRLLYVAMTRTQDKLIFVSAVSNLENKVSELSSLLIATECKINSYLFSRTKSYSDWLILSMILHPEGKKIKPTENSLIALKADCRIKLSVISGVAIGQAETATDNENKSVDFELAEEIKKNLGYTYPFGALLSLQSKASVSKLANSAESAKYTFSAMPSFMSVGGITAAERGTAIHKVMQYFDFSKSNNIEAELDRLYEWQFISEREREAISLESISKFFKSGIFKRITASKLLKREMRFLTEVKANTVDKSLGSRFDDETVIVQGAVDLCFTEPDGLVILDFKSDRVASPEALKEAYGEQLNIYALACEKIFEMPVKQKIIYSFNLGLEIEV